MHQSTLGIETLPQQTGVYVPRRLARWTGPWRVPLLASPPRPVSPDLSVRPRVGGDTVR